jgi:2-oxoisovalerate dehydrogenase E1 component
MSLLKEYKQAFLIRKIEEFFLEMFKLGKISGTVHTCIGQEFSGIFAAKYSIEGDCVVSNHRGHGHYLSFTQDYDGLIGELLGNSIGCSMGIGGSQHLFNRHFFSNGIQGGMLPIAAGIGYSNKHEKNRNISIAFLGDGTLGEGILYETLNISSLWEIPIVFILEKNNISQSTSFDQNFAGTIRERIIGFGIKFFSTSIYDIIDLDSKFENAFKYSRIEGKPVFIEIEMGRLMSHSKGDDNRDEELIKTLIQKDPLNNFIQKNNLITLEWEKEYNEIVQNTLKKIQKNSVVNLNSIILSNNKDCDLKIEYFKVDTAITEKSRFNELIYNELDKVLLCDEKAIIIGEDIENNNTYNPKEYGGAFKVTRDLSNKYPDRVKNTPISEQAIVGIAIGSALRGNVSIVEIMFGDFTTLVLDQLLQHVSKFTLMYGKKLTIPFILRTPMGGFRGYGPTHSQSLEKHFLGIPGLKVIALNQLVQPTEIFKLLLKRREPTLLIENKTLYTKKLYENLPEGYNLQISNSSNFFPVANLKPQEGISDLTIVCYGGIVDEVLKAVDILFFEQEILVDIFVPSDISNVYIPNLEDSLNQTKKLCLIEEGNSFAGFSSELVSNLIENNFNKFSLLRISNNTIIPSSRELEELILPTASKIKTLIINFLK